MELKYSVEFINDAPNENDDKNQTKMSIMT